MKKTFRKTAFALAAAMTVCLMPASLANAAETKTVYITPQCAKSAASALSKLSLYTDDEGYDLRFFGVSDYKTQLKNGTLRWVSSDERVATVDKNGVVTPVGTGVTFIALEVGTGEYVCSSVKVTVSERNAVTPTPTPVPQETTPTVAPTTTPTAAPTKAAESGDGSVVLYNNDRSAYKRSLMVTGPMEIEGEIPKDDAIWADAVLNFLRIKLYDPITEVEYTIDSENPLPTGWTLVVNRMNEDSSYINSVAVFLPASGGCYSYVLFPVNKNVRVVRYAYKP